MESFFFFLLSPNAHESNHRILHSPYACATKNEWLEAKPRTCVLRPSPVLCHASEPGKQAGGAGSHGRSRPPGLTAARPSPTAAKSGQRTHSPAQTSPSCSRPHPPLPYSHQAGPLHSQLCLCAPSHLSGRHTPFHLLEAWYRRTAPPPPHLVTFQETRQNCLRSILRKAFILQQTTRFCFWSSNVRGVVKDKGSGRKPPGFKVMFSHLLAVCPGGCAFVPVGELNEPVRR